MKLLRRWRYLIDWRSQLGTALQIVAVLAGICLICAVAVKFVKSDEALEAMGSDEVRAFLYRVTAAQFLVSAATLAALAIFLTHRFAGPAYAIERALHALRDGKVDQQLHLRQRDYLKGMAAAVEELRQRETERRKQIADVRSCIAEGDADGAREIIAKLLGETTPAPAQEPSRAAAQV
jgi:signal peptidase II